MKFSKTSLVLLLIQLALVSSVAAKYLYQRWSCPRVWTRAVVYDPQLVMRGRYLSLRLYVDGCGRIAPPAEMKPNSWINDPNFNARWNIESHSDRYYARLKVENNKLVAIPFAKQAAGAGYAPFMGDAEGITVLAPPGSSCNALRIWQPVNFYIPEHATVPAPLQSGQELWIEVTVPPKGPPRPLQLALKQDGAWKPLAFQ